MLLRRQQYKLDFGQELKTWENALHEIILVSAKAKDVGCQRAAEWSRCRDCLPRAFGLS